MVSEVDLQRRMYATLSVLLQYPDSGTLRLLDEALAATAHCDVESRQDLAAFAAWLRSSSLLQSQAHYVELFDRKRRACLYLSYYLNGDTRRRGMALVRFKELYREFGWEPLTGELPDFLPTLLQFGAVADVQAAEVVLAGHRAGLDVLHRALADAGSPYSFLTAVLLRLVPALGTQTDHVMQLIEQGPPVELVGLEPFGAPERIGV